MGPRSDPCEAVVQGLERTQKGIIGLSDKMSSRTRRTLYLPGLCLVDEVHCVGVARPGQRDMPAAGAGQVDDRRAWAARDLTVDSLGRSVQLCGDLQRVTAGHRQPRD